MDRITRAEFSRIQQFMFDASGITISEGKEQTVCGRLGRRLEALGMRSFTEYLALLDSEDGRDETQFAIDLLTTNETYFFREPKHFDVLARLAEGVAARSDGFRVWSAACSSGEECYSIAMILADRLGASSWDVLGSDISTRVLRRARIGHYSLERTEHIPTAYLKRFCLKGTGQQDGTLLIDRELRSRVAFSQINLNQRLPGIGSFDVIFLRNVMIYFSAETKRQIVARIAAHLKPGGHLFIGHAESLNGISTDLHPVAPAVYRRHPAQSSQSGVVPSERARGTETASGRPA
jgi:chemotaxis protein methyltransferase CheR